MDDRKFFRGPQSYTRVGRGRGALAVFARPNIVTFTVTRFFTAATRRGGLHLPENALDTRRLQPMNSCMHARASTAPRSLLLREPNLILHKTDYFFSLSNGLAAYCSEG